MKDEIQIKNPPPTVCRRQQIAIDGARVRHFCIRFHPFGPVVSYVPLPRFQHESIRTGSLDPARVEEIPRFDMLDGR